MARKSASWPKLMREAKTARRGIDANNAAVAEVIEAIKQFGIADRDLQTAGIQINPRYNYNNKPRRPARPNSRLPGDQHPDGAHPRPGQDR